MRQINEKERQISQKYEEKRAGINNQSGDDRFYFNIIKMEVERVKYVLRSYLRTRIMKIEKHLFFIVEKDQAHLLSVAEMEYAFNVYESKKSHFNNEFFDKISKKLNVMGDVGEMPDNMSKSNIQFSNSIFNFNDQISNHYFIT